MGQQTRPALDVASEVEHEIRRRSHVDRDRTSHRVTLRPASWREERGEEPRVEGAASRYEIAHHEAHRLTDLRPAREATGRVLEHRGPGDEGLDDAADDVLRGERVRHRPL